MIILNEQQEKIKNAAVSWFLNSSEQLFQITGGAGWLGTGKSVLIGAILQELHLAPNQYLALSYTGAAALVMRRKQFPYARTIHSALYECIEVPDQVDALAAKFGAKGIKKKYILRKVIDPNIRLFFIDEAYMVPKFMVRDILSFGIKVIVAGDSQQLPPVAGEPAFLTGYNVHRLTQIMRQSANNPIVYLANRAIQNLPIHCGRYGNVLVVNETDLHPAMLAYADCILSGTNKTRELMNSTIRQMYGFEGPLPRYGERVICRKNNWDISIDGIALANGLAGHVVNNPDPSSFNADGTFNINFKPDLSDEAFYDIHCNYDYFVAKYDEKNDIKNSVYDYRYPGEFFDFAYALTVHLSQGSEYPNVLYFEEFLNQQIMPQLNYTAITRAMNTLIYVKKSKKYWLNRHLVIYYLLERKDFYGNKERI